MNYARKIKFKIGKYILVSAFILLFVRSAFFDLFFIPSHSMMDAMNSGDVIILNKLYYSGIFSGVLFYLGFNSCPKINDILVFRMEARGFDYWVKRCIARPGDVIEICGKAIILNGKYVVAPTTVRHSYKIWCKKPDLLAASLRKCGIDGVGSELRRQPNYYSIFLTESQKNSLSLDRSIDSITINNSILSTNDNIGTAFYSSNQNVAVSNFGPLKVPYKGWKLKLDSISLMRYQKTLHSFEGVDISRTEGGKYYLNGLQVEYYEFKNNYYFLLGDNRDASVDSRIFGAIPSRIITGKVVKVIQR